MGLSPRAWGTLIDVMTLGGEDRFIPTGVGNTKADRRQAFQGTVHPHGRGEHYPRMRRPPVMCGSSPRAWGTRPDTIQIAIGGRFIPTGVGNTASETCDVATSAVHPHGRGEHQRPWRGELHSRGSSPRAWGTPIAQVEPIFRDRFIPTGVGNTLLRCSRISSCSVHPHGRGEHASVPSMPPPDHRFIPTGVGNTAPRPEGLGFPAVHPHGRGEHILCLD